jgi:HAD superfamily hydrolase (TIGR01549 family)
MRRDTMTRMGVDAVIFDWGGTLTPWHTVDVVPAWRAVASVIDPGRVDQLATRLVAAEEALWRRTRDEHAAASLQDVFAMAELTVAEDALLPLFEYWEPHTHTDPDVRPLFEQLRERGIKVGVLSNTMWPRAEHDRILARDGVLDLLDATVYSSELPWAKPHPQAYAAALKAVGAEADRAVYVGDRMFEDVYGAQAAGLRAVHVPHSDIPAHQLADITAVPDAVVERLLDLIPVVDGWR